MNIEQLKQDLIRDEGVRLNLYADSEGNPTIGIGRNLLSPGLSNDEVDYLLMNDINRVLEEISHIEGFESLTEPRQRVLAEMCFNMGINKLLGFHNMFKAIANGDMQLAHDEILNSAAARELPKRYARLAEMWLNG